jgi:hypothetical protein
MLRSVRGKALAFYTTFSSSPVSMGKKKKHNSGKNSNNAFSDYDPNDGSTIVIKSLYPDDTKLSSAVEASEVQDSVVDDHIDDQPKALDDSAQSGLGRHLGLFSTTFLMCVPTSPVFSGL